MITPPKKLKAKTEKEIQESIRWMLDRHRFLQQKRLSAEDMDLYCKKWMDVFCFMVSQRDGASILSLFSISPSYRRV